MGSLLINFYGIPVPELITPGAGENVYLCFSYSRSQPGELLWGKCIQKIEEGWRPHRRDSSKNGKMLTTWEWLSHVSQVCNNKRSQASRTDKSTPRAVQEKAVEISCWHVQVLFQKRLINYGTFSYPPWWDGFCCLCKKAWAMMTVFLACLHEAATSALTP